ncbi:MAG: hypothetical protein NTY15_11960 [Planctomycetota bacterium]|nr:hypothetical protein [Planctomycetota bacterium]
MKQRFEKQEAELKQIEQRLEEAKAKLAQRKSKQNEIVDRRIADLLQKHDDLDWASSTAGQSELMTNSSEKSSTAVPDMVRQIHDGVAKTSTPNAAKPINSIAKAANGVPNADSDDLTSIKKANILDSSAESGQISAVMNEAIELEATIDGEVSREITRLSDANKKRISNALSLPKRIRLLELKLDVLQVNKESIIRRLGVELSLGEANLEVAKQDLEISNQLAKEGAEGLLENRKKKFEMQVAETRVVQLQMELQSFNDQMDNLAKRVEIVLTKYEEKFGEKYSKPADILSNDK